jgi:myo-inositol-1(or 4)-monophosphatase
MTSSELRRALTAAVRAARAAGRVMRQNLHTPKKINAESRHDIKLELDVRCQRLIERSLRRDFPDLPLLGEEGESGRTNAARRWVVDPIDGTVNFAHGIPHACVSIALEEQAAGGEQPGVYRSVVGVVYDPFTGELWTALRGGPARLNGRIIHVSQRRRLDEAMIAVGFSKSPANLRHSLPLFCRLSRRARKVRSMGSGALALVYVATGRFDGYVERRISRWDIAAGGLIVESAGGEFRTRPIRGYHRFSMVASNRWLGKQLPMPR